MLGLHACIPRLAGASVHMARALVRTLKGHAIPRGILPKPTQHDARRCSAHCPRCHCSCPCPRTGCPQHPAANHPLGHDAAQPGPHARLRDCIQPDTRPVHCGLQRPVAQRQRHCQLIRHTHPRQAVLGIMHNRHRLVCVVAAVCLRRPGHLPACCQCDGHATRGSTERCQHRQVSGGLASVWHRRCRRHSVVSGSLCAVSVAQTDTGRCASLANSSLKLSSNFFCLKDNNAYCFPQEIAELTKTTKSTDLGALAAGLLNPAFLCTSCATKHIKILQDSKSYYADYAQIDTLVQLVAPITATCKLTTGGRPRAMPPCRSRRRSWSFLPQLRLRWPHSC
ncbi:hypothetical protein BC831DRAFT_470137, partial [Entophlyctis helioformis]